MEQPATKDELLEQIRSSRAALEEVVAEVGEARLTEPGATGHWSVKDVLAHIAVGHDWAATQLERIARGEGPDPAELQQIREAGLFDQERRNAYYYEQNRGRDPADVLAWWRQACQRYVTALEALPEPLLWQPAWWTGARLLGRTLDPGHDREHAEGIRTGLGLSG
jgi:uncharacterized protein (TIGR03083 family)